MTAHRQAALVGFLLNCFLFGSVVLFRFLISPVTMGTTVAWMCGVFSFRCRSAETTLSFPNVSRNHFTLSSHHSPSDPLHILRRSRQHSPQDADLVSAYLAGDPCGLDPVLYGLGPIFDTVGERNKIFVQMCTHLVDVLRIYSPLDMGGHWRIVI